jgi:hypothetical protein
LVYAFELSKNARSADAIKTGRKFPIQAGRDGEGNNEIEIEIKWNRRLENEN